MVTANAIAPAKQLLLVIRGSWRFRWVALVVAWLVCAAGWTTVYLMPNVYEAKARFYIDASSRLRDIVSTLGMEPDISSRVFLVRQAMLGRPQLEKVARQTDLDLRARDAEEQEALIIGLRSNISINTGRSREAQNLFTIAFQDTDRDMSVAVVRTLLNTFLEDVLEKKDIETARAEEFLQDQLQHYRQLLTGVEQELEQFRKDYPSYAQNANFFARLERERANLEELSSNKRIEENKREELRRQLSSIDPYVPVQDDSGGNVLLDPRSEMELRISALERQRKDLLLRFTERHPNIVAIDEQLRQLNGQLGDMPVGEASSDGTGLEGSSRATNPVYMQIQMSLSESNLNLTELEARIADTTTKIETLEADIQAAPELERIYTQLVRDYDNYRGLYNEIQLQTERERIGRVGAERDVVTFDIIDPPVAGLEPVAPQRSLFLFAVLIVALGVGAVAAVLLNELSKVYQETESLSHALELPVLGSISRARPEEHRKQRNREVVFFAAAASLLVVAFVGALVLQDPGVEYVQRILQRASA